MKNLLKYAVMIAVALLPSLAIAQAISPDSPGFFTIPSTDLFKTLFLDKVFPSDGSKSILSPVIGPLNASLLFMAGVLLAIKIAFGITNTAHDGELLGKKMSSVWVPIRYVGAPALMMPIGAVGAGNWCAAQMIVIFLITTGVAAADRCVESFASSVGNIALVAPSVPTDEVAKTFRQMILNQACVASLQNTLTKNPDALAFFTNGVPAVAGVTPITTDKGFKLFYGLKAGDDSQISACGSFVFEPNSPVSTVASQAANPIDFANNNSVLMNPANASLDSALKSMRGDIFKAQSTALMALNDSALTIAQASLQSNTPVLPASEIALQKYSQSMTASVASIASSNNQMINGFEKHMAESGFVGLGSLYFELGVLEQALSSAASQAPSVASMKYPSHVIQEVIGSDLISLSSRLKKEDAQKTQTGLAGAANSDGIMDMLASPMVSISAFMTRHLGNGNLFYNETDGPANFLLSSQLLGSKMLWTADALLIVPFTPIITAAAMDSQGSAARALENSLPGPQNAVSDELSGSLSISLCILIFPFVAMLYVGGITLEIVLPLTPYVLWISAIVAYSCVCIATVVGAPVIAMSLMLEGSDEHGGAGRGYTAILGAFATPALLVAGLVGSMAVMSFASSVMSYTFNPTIQLMIQDIGMGVPTLIGVVFVFISLQMGLLKIAFTLISDLPHTVLEFLGSSAAKVHSEAEKGHAAHLNAAAVAAVVNTGSGAAGGAQNVKGTMDRDAGNNDNKGRNQERAGQAEPGNAAKVEGKANDQGRLARSALATATKAGGFANQAAKSECIKNAQESGAGLRSVGQEKNAAHAGRIEKEAKAMKIL